MTYLEPTEETRPRHEAFFEMVRTITIYGTLSFLAVVGMYLVFQSFGGGFYPGVRSFAGALLPIIIGSFVYLASRKSLRAVATLHTGISFPIGIVAGVLVMGVLHFFAQESSIPLAELVVASCFSVLVFSSGAAPGDKPLSMYYGVISGLLLYIILFGFPLIA